MGDHQCIQKEERERTDEDQSNLNFSHIAFLRPSQHSEICVPFVLVSFLIIPPNHYHSCLDIDGERRLKYDLQIKCYQGIHTLMSLGVALPALIAWGIGIPMFALYLLFKERKTVESI